MGLQLVKIHWEEMGIWSGSQCLESRGSVERSQSVVVWLSAVVAKVRWLGMN
jgi:hypothetical protein